MLNKFHSVATYVLLIAFLFMTHSIEAQETISFSKLDSMYDEKAYTELISLLEEEMTKTELTQLNKAKYQYVLSNSYYKVSDFVHCWKTILLSYQEAKKVNLSDSSQTELFLDIAQRLGDYSFQAEEYTIGIGALEEGIEVGEKYLDKDFWRLSKLYHKAGAIYRVMTKFDKSIARLESGQKFLDKLSEEKRNYIGPVFLSEMAQVYNDNNQLSKSISIFLDLLRDATQNGNSTRISIYNNNIGIAYERRGDFGKAEYHFRKSLEAKLDVYGEKTPKIISNYNNLGRINTKLERYSTALSYFEKLKTLISEVFGPSHIKNADTEYNIGTSFLLQNKFPEALSHFRKAVSIRETQTIEDNLNIGEANHMVAVCLIELKEYDQAIKLLEKALLTRQKQIKTRDTEQSLMYSSLHKAYLSSGNIPKAELNLSKSFDALGYDICDPFQFNQIEAPIKLLEPLRLSIDYEVGKGVGNLKNNNDIKDHIQICDSLVQFIKYKYDDISTRKIISKEVRKLNESILEYIFLENSLNQKEENIAKAFQVFEKANNTFLYENLAEEDIALSNGMPTELIAQKVILQDSILEISQFLGSIGVDEQINSATYSSQLSKLNRIKGELYSLTESISKDFPGYFESIYDYPVITLSSVQKKIPSGEILISYFKGSKYVYGIAITKNNSKFYKLGKSDILEQKITSLLEILETRAAEGERERLINELYVQLIKPFEISKKEKLSIVTDDILGTLPFELLSPTDIKNALLHTHYINYQYSATLKFTEKKPIRTKGSLAFAPIFEDSKMPTFAYTFYDEDRFRDELGPLPESRREVEIISELLGSEYFLGQQATEAAFKNRAPGMAHLHLATHGFVDHENPDVSRLFFSTDSLSEEDGKLYSYEIMRMNLNADLITLSACNTGVGKIQNGEGVASLGRAFSYANCPNQLISLWSANDKATTELMALYYKNIKNGIGKAEALTNAKREYLSSTPDIFKHPYFWAGFVYFGEDTPLNLNTLKVTPMTLCIGALLAFGIFLFYISRKFIKMQLTE